MTKSLFVTGIGTDVGKTITSAVLTEYLKADYWKPVQCGLSDGLKDSDVIRHLISNPISVIHPETYYFQTPASPHYAAQLENVLIDAKKFISPPGASDFIIIEGAGGVMVPMNENFTMLELIKQLKSSVVVVTKNYLGSINHTLMTLEILQSHHIKIEGLVVSGQPNDSTESIIQTISGVKKLFHIPEIKTLNQRAITGVCNDIKPDWSWTI